MTVRNPLGGTARTPIVVLLLLTLGVAPGLACSETDADSASGSGADSTTVDDVWIRPTPPGSDVGAFYLRITNPGDTDDELVAVTSPRCTMAELHRTVTDDGVMGMEPADPDDLRVPSGGELVLEPSGLHVMCMGLTEPVEAGERIAVSVELAEAGTVEVEAVAEDR